MPEVGDLFGADRQVVGRIVTLSGEPHEIIGVVAPGFRPIGPLSWAGVAQGLALLDPLASSSDRDVAAAVARGPAADSCAADVTSVIDEVLGAHLGSVGVGDRASFDAVMNARVVAAWVSSESESHPLREQCRVAPVLADLALVHHEDAIRVLNGRQPVSHDQGRSVMHQIGQGQLHDALEGAAERELAGGHTRMRELRAGTALVAPGDRHMTLRSSGTRLMVALHDGPLVSRHRPSVDVLFRSVAAAVGPSSVGVILTGMGRDGAVELLQLRRLGAVTIAQSPESSVVAGMPGERLDVIDGDVINDRTALVATE